MAYTSGENPAKIKKTHNNEEIVTLLVDDMKGEHAAIIQYLQHAYKIGEDGGEVSAEVEGIARDEMRHFRWLGELVVELGGDPTMQRDPIFLDGPSATDLLALDVDAEQRAIDQYRAHIEAIDHPKVTHYVPMPGEVLIYPHLRKYFPDAEELNKALRGLLALMPEKLRNNVPDEVGEQKDALLEYILAKMKEDKSIKSYKALDEGYVVEVVNENGTTSQEKYLPVEHTMTLDPDVAKYFSDSQSVNNALNGLLALIPAKRKRKTADRTKSKKAS